MGDKSGNLCLFILFTFSNLALIGVGLILIVFGVYEMVQYGKFNVIDGGTCAAGLITALVAMMAFCGRRSLVIVTMDLFFLIILLCGYVALTICYWQDLVCTYDEDTKKICEDLDKIIGNILKYALLGTDAAIVFWLALSQLNLSHIVVHYNPGNDVQRIYG